MYSISCVYFQVRESGEDINRYALLVSEGQTEYFDEIDKNIRPNIIRQTYKYQMTDADRQDLIQDLMEIAFKNCYKFNPSLGDYRHYTYRVTKFESMKLYYKKVREKNLYMVKADDGVSLTVSDYQTDELDPADIIVFEDNENYLMDDAGPYSKLERTVYSCFRKGYNAREISDSLGMTEKTVRNTLYRAKVKRVRVHGHSE